MSDLCPTCYSEIGIWLDDPILTPKGLSGDEYKGNTEDNVKHMKELQDRCIAEEETNSVSPRTTFSTIGKNGKRELTLQHINEIRQSIEKILFAKAGGGTDITPLFEKYFNYDAEGNYMGTGKTNWTDTELDNKTEIKAIHIEDLRHPIPETEELPEYPGTGFLRRQVTLDLTNVHTTFNNLLTGDTIIEGLDNGDEVSFDSNFSVRNTNNYGTSFEAFYPLDPFNPPSRWSLSGSISNITAQITGYEIKWVKVAASANTDGKYLYHYWYDDDEDEIEVWTLSEYPTIEVCDYDKGNPVDCREVEPIDSERASRNWISSFIGAVNKYSVYEGTEFKGWFTEFKMYPGGWNVINIDDLPSPAPFGYECKKIGNGTPEEYWEAWNKKYGYEQGDSGYIMRDYIGGERVTVDLGGSYYRRYSYNWYYEYSASGAPIRAEFEREGKPLLIYTCNVS